MALSLMSVDSDELVKQRKGYIAISASNFDNTNEDEITAGSVFECADSVYYCDANEDIDSTATLAGLGNSWVYVYFDPTGGNLWLYCSATAPAWDDTKQGYYLAASPTHRCVYLFFKVGAGNYTMKTIPLNRSMGIMYDGIHLFNDDFSDSDKVIRFASDASISWDEAENQFEPNKGINLYGDLAGGAEIQLATKTGAGNSSEFIITKPITCLLETTAGVAETGILKIKYSGGYVQIGFNITATTSPQVRSLNPGTYIINNSDAGYTTTAYAIGTYGSPDVTVDDILG